MLPFDNTAFHRLQTLNPYTAFEFFKELYGLVRPNPATDYWVAYDEIDWGQFWLDTGNASLRRLTASLATLVVSQVMDADGEMARLNRRVATLSRPDYEHTTEYTGLVG